MIMLLKLLPMNIAMPQYCLNTSLTERLYICIIINCFNYLYATSLGSTFQHLVCGTVAVVYACYKAIRLQLSM